MKHLKKTINTAPETTIEKIKPRGYFQKNCNPWFIRFWQEPGAISEFLDENCPYVSGSLLISSPERDPINALHVIQFNLR